MVGRRSKKKYSTKDMEKVIYSIKSSKIKTLKEASGFEYEIYW